MTKYGELPAVELVKKLFDAKQAQKSLLDEFKASNRAYLEIENEIAYLKALLKL